MSRKANRKSRATPRRRETSTTTAKNPKPWAFLVGIVLAIPSLFLAEAMLREIFIGLHRDDYVRDELVVSSLSSPDDEASLHGQIASTRESVTVPVGVAGPGCLDRFRELQREGRIKGQRVSVWYLPQETPWWWGAGARVRPALLTFRNPTIASAGGASPSPLLSPWPSSAFSWSSTGESK